MGIAGDLAKRKCEACTAETPTLERQRAQQLHGQIDQDWHLEDDRIIRHFGFKNFRDPFALATKVALLAEEEGHHPDLEISWGRLVVSLKTHASGGLTDNDFIMAAKIDRMV